MGRTFNEIERDWEARQESARDREAPRCTHSDCSAIGHRRQSDVGIDCECACHNPPPDYAWEDHGTIVLLDPVSDAAREWIAQNLPEDCPRFGNRFAIEARYVNDIDDGMQDAGLQRVRR